MALGMLEGMLLGRKLDLNDGFDEGMALGILEGMLLGSELNWNDGMDEGIALGTSDGTLLGRSDGCCPKTVAIVGLAVVVGLPDALRDGFWSGTREVEDAMLGSRDLSVDLAVGGLGIATIMVGKDVTGGPLTTTTGAPVGVVAGVTVTGPAEVVGLLLYQKA
jgi:hypothetical protein